MTGFLSDLVQYQGFFQMIAVLGIGGTFQIGFQISTITYMSRHVKAFINETWLERYGYPIHQDNLLFLWSITVSIFGIGGLLGSSGSRYLTVKYGKKKCLLCNNLLMIVAASIMGCSKIAQSFEMILIGRFMCGISAGLCAPLHHQYIGEISPRKLRGFANSTSSFFWSLGKAIGQISGQRELLGSQSLWPMLMASCGLPAVVQLVTLPFFPESPPYLLMHKGDQEGFKKAIRQLWGEGHHQAETDDIMKEKATMKNTKILSVLELMKERAFRWQLYMIVILTATVQLCGINAIYFYTFEVLQAAGFDERMVSYMTLSVGLSELLASVVCSSIIERLGRKVLLRGGYLIMGSLLAGITVTLSLQDFYFWMPYCSLCLIILFTVVFGVGPAGATVSIRAEIFKLSCRPPAFVIGAVLNWMGVFVIGTTFPFIVVQFQGLFQMIFVLGIGGSFPYGFHISVINYPSVHIRKFINETWIERHGSPLHPETVMLLWSFIVSVYGIGGLLGSLCCGYLTTKYRKKKCQMCTNLIMLVAALFMAFSKTAKSFEMILFGRFLYGIGTGFSLNIHPQYVGEISPKKLRGFTNSTVAVFLTLGKLTGQVIGLREILGSEALWPWLLASSGLSALVQLVALPFFPDSPSYLLIQKGNEEACRKAIRKLWGEGDHQAEIDDIMKEKAAMTSTKTLRVLEVIKARSLRWQLYILVTVMTTLQLCGINAIYFYSFEVFHTAKFEEYLIPYVSLGVGLCECLSSILCSTLIERFGRKVLLWGGYMLMCSVLALLTMTLSLQHQFFWMNYFSVILIFLFVIFYGIGPSGATISIMVEIFSQSFRPSAFLIVGCINWMGLFVLGMIFPLIVDNLGPFCFLIFLGILALSAIFIYLYLPETKGKSIMEIKAEFNKLNFGKKETSVTENNFPKEQLFCTRL
uniref:Solute carrier family 2, facilitated glucose transporter member 5 n=2 Tax=Falco TaxID=8952 RepID=A0A8C4UA89_FALTI